MSMIRTHKRENPFVQLDKGFIGGNQLSLKATGLLTYFLSKPDDWQIYMKDVQNQFKDGETSIRSAMKELIEAGYIYRWRERNEKGQLGSYNYEVYERPEFNPNFPDEKEDKKPKKKPVKKKTKKPVSVDNKGDNPKRENPVLDNPVLDNQALTNNKGTNNKDTNNKDNNNLSITESAITELDVPICVQKQLILKKDRLIDDNINILDIELMYNAYKDKMNKFEFAHILGNVLESTKGKIRNINHLMTKSITNHLEKPQQAEKEQNKRVAVVPDWFKKQKEESSYSTDYSQYDFSQPIDEEWLEKDRKEIDNMIQRYAEGDTIL